jgi:hypothetical protein
MELDEHVRAWTEQLTAVTALADERTREIAAALGDAGAAAARLVLLNALSVAAAEITQSLLDLPGAPTVSVRLDGAEASFDVRAQDVTAVSAPVAEDGDATARITLRLSERLKDELDAAAEREGLSVNGWVVRALKTALDRARGSATTSANAHRITGWING